MRTCLCAAAELVARLYEAAVKKVPLSEEYHSHLFMAYARVGEYKKMQQVSRILVLRCYWSRSVSHRSTDHCVCPHRLEWPCTRSSPRTPTTSGLS